MPQGSSRRKIRVVAHRVALVLAGGMVAAVLAEVVIRVVAPVHLGIWTDREMWAHDEILGWRMRPSIEVQQIFDRGRRVPVSLNSQGFREQEEQPPPEPGSIGITVFGDSFAFGWGVRIEDRLTEVIERERGAVNCANFGVSGYSTDQEILLYRRRGCRTPADVVVLMYVANDQPANISRFAHGYYKPVFVLEDDQLTLSNIPVPRPKIRLRLKWELMRRSAFFNLIRERTEVVQGWFAPQPAPAVRRPVSRPENAEFDAKPYSRMLTRRLILEMNSESLRTGARFVVMNSVSAADLEIDPEAVSLEKWCRSKDILWVDTHAAFRSRLDLEPDCGLFLRDRHHWNARGHELAAECLGQALEEAGLIPPEID